MILPLFPTYLCYCELLWQHFPPVLLKLQLYQLESNIPNPSCTRRSSTEILWARKALPHASPYTTQYLCIHYSKINALFSQHFSLNHRTNTQTPAFWGRIKLTKNVILSTSTAERKNFILKTQCFAPILQKLLFHGHCHWQITRK
jgi:hypothetical protein